MSLGKKNRPTAHGVKQTTYYDLLNQKGGTVAVPNGTPMQPVSSVASVPVTSNSWTSDSSLYEDAATVGAIYYYVDLAHGLGVGISKVLAFKDTTTGRVYDHVEGEQWIDKNTHRVWLAKQPNVDMLFLVAGA